MTREEVIRMIRNDMKLHHDNLSGQYRQALNMAIEALKRQQPKKVAYVINGLTGLPVSFCPSCGEGVNMYAYGRNDLKQVFCPYCGQPLDWKDGEQE